MINICRLCLGINRVHNSIDDRNSDLLLKIVCCLPVKPHKFVGLPEKVCDYCVLKIESIHKYFNIVINSESKLKCLLDSGIDALNTFYQEIQVSGNLKQEPDLEQNDTSVDQILPVLSISKNTQTEDWTEEIATVIPETKVKVCIKEEINDDYSGDGDIIFNNDPEQNEGLIEYDSDDDITLINLATNQQKIKLEIDTLTQNTVIQDVKRKKSKKKRIKTNDDFVKFKRKYTKRKDRNFNIDDGIVGKDKMASGKVLKIKSERRNKWFDDDENDPKKWQCLTCFIYLPCRTDLMQHYKEHLKSPVKFEQDTGVKKELPEQDCNNDSSTAESESQKKICDTENCMVAGDSGSYNCPKCDKVFANKKSIYRHLLCHQDNRPFVCNLCGRTYKRAYEIVLHSRAHSGAKTLNCKYDDCNYSTVYQGALLAHENRHEPNYKYKCEICHKGFDVFTWFQEHKNVHTGARPFTCDVCGKSFIYSRYLASHRKSVHQETTPGKKLVHKCESCPAQFNTRKELRTHMKEHTGTQVVLCDICGKGLSSNEHLKFHRRIHLGVKPHACKTCGKAFVKKCNLTLHERVHSGERPHVCPHCGKAFSQRSTLVIHERYHSGARPYKCDSCHKGFVAQGLLSVHLKTCGGTNLASHDHKYAQFVKI